MGLAGAFPGLPLPRVLLQMGFFFGYLRWFISWIFNAVGLGDLLHSDWSWPENDTFYHSHSQQQYYNYDHQVQFRSSSMTMMIQEALPIVRYEELAVAAAQHVGSSCAVCLYEFEAADEVRPLSNCRHVYHRSCLDRWMEHGRRTCPLCRAPLVSGETRLGSSDQMWDSAESGLDMVYYDELVDASFSLVSSVRLPSQNLLLAHQLLSTSSTHW